MPESSLATYIPESWLGILVADTFWFIAISILLSSMACKKSLPPGPSGIPWIGQGFKVPMLHSHLYYTRLARKYGDIYLVTALGQKIVVLNSYTAAFEVLGKHGNTHCNRPANPFLTRFLGLEHTVALGDATKDWKECRRLYQLLLNKDVVRTNHAQDIASQVYNYILRVMELGQDTNNEVIDTVVHKIILQTTYGIAAKDDDPLLSDAIHSTNVASTGLTPGKYLVNSFPILQYLPGWVPFQTWRTDGEKSRPWLERLKNIPWERMLTGEANGSAEESFARGLYCERSPTNEHLLKITGLTNLIAGVEPMTGVCRMFILAMLLYPDVQQKAQEELDRVVGNDRLPTVDDQPNLPYLNAVVKEVLRFRPVAPLSVPTSPTKVDAYKDYLIPQDVIVVQNSWAISRDERMYPDANCFDPDRWLVPDPPKDPRLWYFGIGRRVCPGVGYAEILYGTLFMTLLATVDIIHAYDKDGKEIFVDPSAPTTGRFACIPEAFSYSLRPRSDSAASLLSNAVPS
ncbi:cytochrome P450 [Clavulina sp. PMI_390]|nr:cytochrome P450 [Clavulina sp. PMI_390]